MSFHFLIDAERCPRSVALRYSSYSSIWKRRGYPEKPSISSLAGQIIHSSLQFIVSELACNGCNSVLDPRAIQVLKKIEGYSHVISETTTSLLARLSENPRFERVRDIVSSTLRTRMPDIREQIQILLSRLSWKVTEDSAHITSNSPAQLSSAAIKRYPLKSGAHFEVELRASSLKWLGIVDLIDVSDTACVITDFKSGERSDLHALQLAIYALLWYRDADLNPDRKRASKLVLSYPRADEILAALDVGELDQLAAEIATRTGTVRKALTFDRPIAKLSAENCPRCHIRHLCDEYWTEERKRVEAPQTQNHAYFDDVEIQIHNCKSSNVWDCACQLSNSLSPGTKIQLRVSPTDILLSSNLAPGMRVRLTDALVSNPPGNELPVVHITGNTEILFI